MDKLAVPVYVQVKQDDGTWKTQLQDAPIGGFTDANGKGDLIYQCGKCGILVRHNTQFNAHRKKVHKLEGIAFGWADPPTWQELDITEEQITKVEVTA